MTADFDWRQEGPQTWDIDIETDAGEVALRHGGNELWVGGVKAEGAADIMGEYPALYARMAALVHGGDSDVDLSPDGACRGCADAGQTGDRGGVRLLTA